MKLLLILGIIILAQLAPAKSAHADFFILYDKTTKEVINIADNEKDFMIAEDDKSKLAIKQFSGNFADYEIGNLSDYKISGNNIVVNTQKVSDQVAADELAQEIAVDQKLINDKLKDIAIDALRAEGKELKHIKKTGE